MAIGYKNRHLNKAEIYEISRAYMNDFENLFNSTECRVLLNLLKMTQLSHHQEPKNIMKKDHVCI